MKANAKDELLTYLDEDIDVNLFEVEADESCIETMKIKDFKELAVKNNLLKDEEKLDNDNVINCSFEVVEE